MCVFSCLAFAQDGTELVKERIEYFRELGTEFKRIRDEIKATSPDLARIQDSAQAIRMRGAEMLRWFPPGSEPPQEVPKSWLDTIAGWFSSDDKIVLPEEERSHAKHTVWTEPAKFREDHDKFQREADQMWQSAKEGRIGDISTQFGRLGQTCNVCHNTFRETID
jgi:cytochrome c556